jgi:N-acetylmuramoyl-L-alanine amidase
MSGKTHTVQQGETLYKIAKRHGFSDWRTIYNHADNNEFRKKRPNPNIIYPGDKITIPQKETKEDSGETEQRHRFRLKGDRQWIMIVLRDARNQPIANTSYKLNIGGKIIDDKTDGEGLLEQEIPPNADQAVLAIEGQEFLLKIGYLDPVDTLTGWRARLNNLGYKAGKVDGEENEELQSAIEEFQCDQGLKVDGIVGPKTQAKLEEIHGS